MYEGASITSDRYTIAAQEDRATPRTLLQIPAQLRMSGTKGVPTVITDLSLGGFCAAAITRAHPGTVCWLTIAGLEAMMAEVVWWENRQVGCSFHQLLSPIIHDGIVARWTEHY
jgi:hypothetical protein